jgi:tetratricopeptide (TPR) repeat protein
MDNDLTTAIRHHQMGALSEAAQLYQGILARNPQHPDALHLLGVVALQQGNAARAVELISRALALYPKAAAFHCSLGEAYRAMGQLDRAVASSQTALRLQPNYPEAANNLGLALLSQGRTDDAIARFQEALRLRPDFAMVVNNLGNALRTKGDIPGAVAHFRQALTIDPNLVEAHSNLGQLLLEKKDLQGALFHCREAVRLRPTFPEAHNNLGNVLRELGHLPESKACYAEALRLNPNLAMTYNNMGQAIQEEGNLDQALAWYQEALQREPDSARIHSNLASALEEQEKHDDAIARYELALQLDPNYAEAHNGLGWVRHEQGDFEGAMARYRRALALKPDFAPALSNLGMVREELGDFEAALGCFREALQHDPRHSGALAQMALLLRSKLPDADLEMIRARLADPLLAPGQRSALHFGLAQVLDARREFDQAGEHARQANALSLEYWRQRGQSYDPVQHTRFVDELIAAFNPRFFARTRDFGLDTERPIFIVGLPRSGTTLTEQILAGHSQVFGAGELRFGRESFDALATTLAGGPVSNWLTRLDRHSTRQVAQAHLDQLRQLNAPAARVADKMPDNYLYVGLLATLFPRAKFIHCRRDLRDVAVSCWVTNFRHIRWASDVQHIAARFHDYQRLMDHWRQVLPVQVLEVAYEDTVADLEGIAQRLVAWCGLEWEPACLSFHERRQPVRTASVTQVRQPIYTKSVARWKHYEASLGELFGQLTARGGGSADG